MVDLKQYENTIFKAPIMRTKEIPLKEYLGDRLEAFKEKMRLPDSLVKSKNKKDIEAYKTKTLDAKVIVVFYKRPDKDQVDDVFFSIPSIVGYAKSNLKAFIERNKLSSNTDEWVGKEIELYITKDNYLKVAK